MANEEVPRPSRQQFASRVRIRIADEEEIFERYASNLSSGGMFVHDAAPPPVGSLLAVEFILPSGVVISRLVGRVAHSKRAVTRDDPTAGMGIQFTEYDDAAKSVLADLGVSSAATPVPDGRATGASEAIFAAAPSDSSGPVVGIDFGTTNTCVSIVRDDKARTIDTHVCLLFAMTKRG